MISFRKLKTSFRNAWQGLEVAFREEQSFRLQLVVAGLVIILMFAFPLHYIERAILILVISSVLGLELLNSQLERVLDLLQPNHDPKIKAIKDLSAAAVLIATLGAVLVGLFIFIPFLL